MVRILQAGDFDRRATFLSAELVDDGYGNKVASDLVLRFTLWAHLTFLRGGEAVMGARLAGRQPVVIALRASSASRQITARWLCEIAGQRYAVKEPPRPVAQDGVLEFLAEAVDG